MIVIRTRERVVALTCLIAAILCARAAPGFAQEARVVAERSVDVDGDGALDLVRIEDPPAVSVLLTRAGKPQPDNEWHPFAAAQGTLVAGDVSVGTGQRFGGRRVLVVSALFRGRYSRGPARGVAARVGQAMILSWHGGRLDKLWEGRVGAQGRDADYQLRVAATPSGLLRYQERADIRRCDNQPAYLFPERFDFNGKRFRAVSGVTGIADNAPVLTASRQPPRGAVVAPAIAFRTQSTSAQSYADHAGDLVPPRELDDNDAATVWREGTAGDGRGVFITLASPMSAPEIVAVRLIPGDASSRDAFTRNNRLRRVGLVVGTEHAFWIDFPDDPARERDIQRPYWVSLPAGVRGDCATLVLDQVYPGSGGRGTQGTRGSDTAIAELAVLTSFDFADQGTQGGPDTELIARAATAGDSGDTAARLLIRRGAAAVPAIVAELERAELDAAAQLRLRRVLVRIGDPAGAEQMVEGLVAAELSQGDREASEASLARMGPDAVPALGALAIDDLATPAARVIAARVLASIPDPSARDSLISACGLGDRALRKTVAVGLGQHAGADGIRDDLDVLLAAVERAAKEPSRACESDLWRAIGLLARRAGADGDADVDADVGVDADGDARARVRVARAVATRLAASADYELSYRLLDSAVGLAEEAALEAVRAAVALSREHDSAHDRALRRVVAAGLAGNPHPSARAVLIDLAAGDPDPGVRGRAVEGLGPRQDAGPDSDRAIIDRLAKPAANADIDPVAKPAAEPTAGTSASPAAKPAAGASPAEPATEPWPHVRRAAASALGYRCAVSEPARVTLDHAVDSDIDIGVQRQALDSLVECRAPGIGPRLIDIAGDNQRAGELRQRALTLVPTLRDVSLSKSLIALFSTLRGRAWSDATAVRLAAAAAVAMGRMATDDVVAPLISAAKEASFPEIQAAAVTGLGEMCPPQALPLMAALMGSDQRGVVVAARSAYNRCQPTGQPKD